MLNVADDDDYFSTTKSTSNLANLFNASQSSTQLNESLTYTAPKQPTYQEQEQITSISQQKTQSKVYCAKAVQVQKLVNSIYVSLGKHGLAIIGDDYLNIYEIILYKDKQNVISRCRLIPSFCFSWDIEKATFTDDTNETYQTYFETEQDQMAFLDELKRYKINCVEAHVENKINNNPDEKYMSDSSGTQARANILNRISKVGQSMLPTLTVPTKSKNELSESDSEEVVKTKKVPRKSKREKSVDSHSPTQLHNQYALVNGELVPVVSNTIAPQSYHVINGQLVPSNQMLPQIVQHSSGMFPDSLNVFFAENRTHNSEVRMNLSQLTNKLDIVLGELSNRIPKNIPEKTENIVLIEKLRELESKVNLLEGTGKKLDDISSLGIENTVLRKQIMDLKGVSANTSELEVKDTIIDQLKKELYEFKRNRDSEVSENNQELLATIRKLEKELDVEKNRIKALEANVCNDNISKTTEELRRELETEKKKVKDLESKTNNENLVFIINDLKVQLEKEKMKTAEYEEELKDMRLCLKAALDAEQSLKKFEAFYEANKDIQTTDELKEELNKEILKREELTKIFEENMDILNSDLEKAHQAINIVTEKHQQELVQVKELNKRQLSEIEELRVTEINKLRDELVDKTNENLLLKNQIAILENLTETQKLKLTDFEEQLRTDQANKVLMAKVRENRIKELSNSTKEAMNLMYQSIMQKLLDDDKLMTQENLKKLLSNNMKSATYSIIQDFKQFLEEESLFENHNKDHEDDIMPPPVPEFEVTV